MNPFTKKAAPKKPAGKKKPMAKKPAPFAAKLGDQLMNC